MIEPLVLKGFRDSMPCDEIPKRRLVAKLEEAFALQGFAAIDTPCLEYTEVLLGKGGGETDKQVFRFQDNGKRDVALRFDLTVPFARFTAAHLQELPRPFKRYHIAKVWRGENPQKGRYREFYQCDFDIVGADNEYADYEILETMDHCFRSIFPEGGRHRFHISHRGMFNAFLAHLGAEGKEVEVLRAVDKLRKIGAGATREILAGALGSAESADKALEFISPVEGESFEETITRLENLSGGPSESSERMRKVKALLDEGGIADAFVLDPSITRGLDYYTGIVYETFLTDAPSIGSVCSGGRYNNLCGLYTKESMPGVGSSIGLDRLLAALRDMGSPLLSDSSSAQVVIASEDKARSFRTEQEAARAIRAKGVSCDVYPFDVKKPKALYDYADKTGARRIVLMKRDGGWTVKDTATRQERPVEAMEIASAATDSLS